MRVIGGPNPIRKRGGKSLQQSIVRRIIKEDLHRTTKSALDGIATELLDVARQLSSGTVDSRKEGHPYSSAKPNPAFDPRLINVGFERHPGKRFADSWELLPKTQGPGIRNTAWQAPWLEKGTRRMIARHIDQLILVRADQIVAANFDKTFASDGTAQARAA